MKRFYTTAAAFAGDGGCGVTLDGRSIRTPAGAALVVPAAPLAEAVATEWQAQGETVEPATMPLTQIVGTTIDRVLPRRVEIIADIVRYGGGDLLCYRATEPADLVRRQDEVWSPWLTWLQKTHGLRLRVTTEILPLTQPSDSVRGLEHLVADMGSDWELGALHMATTILGSAVLALAFQDGALSAEEAFAISRLEEIFQAERWGEDPEAAQRVQAIGEELHQIERFIFLLRGS